MPRRLETLIFQLDVWIMMLILLLSLAYKGIVIALLALFFIPGYLTIALVYPRREQMPPGARMAASAGLSPVVIGAVALLHSYLLGGQIPANVSVVVVSLALGLVVVYRRYRTEQSEALWQFQDVTASPWALVKVGVVVSILLTLVYVSRTADKIHPQYTEFYILGPENLAADYPTEVAPGEPVTLTVGVVNHEGAPRTYSVVALQGESAVGVIMPFEVSAEGRHEVELTFEIDQDSGIQRIDVWLGGEGFDFPYRELTLWIEVIQE